MTMNWTLAFIVPVATPSGMSRKLTFENEAGERATLLAGPWTKSTMINKGTLDGAAITAPVALTVALRQSEHGPVLVTTGVKLTLVDPTVTTVKDKTGGDGKALRNLTGGVFALVTYALSAGDDDPALAGGSFAQVSAADADEPALS
jgi:hypothetical protein